MQKERKEYAGILTHNNCLSDENIRATFPKVRVPCLNQLDQSFSGKT